MSGYYYPPQASPPEEEEFDFTTSYPMQVTQAQNLYQTYTAQPTPNIMQQGQFYGESSTMTSILSALRSLRFSRLTNKDVAQAAATIS